MRAFDAGPVLSGARPKWLQIAAILRRDIESLACAGETRLPTESSLTDRFGVSLMTLRQALGCLETEGLIERHRKLGTFLTKQASRPRRIQLLGQIDDVFEQQQSTAIRLLSDLLVSVPEPLKTSFPTARKLRRLTRLRYLDGASCSIAINHLRRDVARQIPAELLTEMPVSQIIQHHTTFRIDAMEQELSAQVADPETASQLGIQPLDPVMVIIGTSYDPQGVVLDVARLCYRADQFSFVTRVNG